MSMMNPVSDVARIQRVNAIRALRRIPEGTMKEALKKLLLQSLYEAWAGSDRRLIETAALIRSARHTLHSPEEIVRRAMALGWVVF